MLKRLEKPEHEPSMKDTDLGSTVLDELAPPMPDTAKIKTGLDNLKGAIQMPGGQSIDTSKLSSTLAGSKAGQTFDTTAQREIQKLLPGITAALSNPNTAGVIKGAIATAQKQAQAAQAGMTPEPAAPVAPPAPGQPLKQQPSLRMREGQEDLDAILRIIRK